VDDAGTSFIEFSLRDPHGLEGAQRGQDGTTDPDRESSFSGGNNSNLNSRRSKSSDFLVKSFRDTVVHGGTTGHNDISVQFLSNIDVALHDGLEHQFVESRIFLTELHGLEESFGASDDLVTDGDGGTVRKSIDDILTRVVTEGLKFGIEVKGNVAVLFFDFSGDFSFGGRGEVNTDFSQKLDHVISEISTGKIVSHDGVGKGVTFEDGNGVGNTITRIEDDTGGSSGGIEGQDGLDGNVEAGNLEVIEHNLNHLFSVVLGVHGSFSEEGGVIFGVNSDFIEIAMMPDLFHIFPGVYNTMLNGV